MPALLFTVLFKGTILSLAGTILTLALRRLSAAQRRAIWSGVLLALACLPLATLFPLPVHVTSPLASQLLCILPSEPFATYSGSTPLPAGQVPASSIWEKTADALALIWLAGFLVLLFRKGIGAWRLRQLLCQCRPTADLPLLLRADEEARRLGLKQRAQILESDEVPVPMVAGAIFPIVILPASWRKWPETEVRAALRHEFSHVHSHDTLVRTLAGFVCALHWPNPLAWSAARSLFLAQEQACDDRVLQGGADVQDYAAQLLTLSRAVQSWPPALAMAQPSHLEQRLRSLVEPRRNRATAGIAMQLTALAIGATLFMAAAAAAAPMLQAEVNVGLTSGWQFTNGSEYPPGANGKFDADATAKSLALTYDFSKGGQYVAVSHALDPVDSVSGVKITVSGPGGGLTVALTDATGQTLLYRLGAIDATTRTLELKLAQPSDSYGGANDRALHLPLKGIRLTMEKNHSLSGTLNFTGVVLETAK